MKTKVRKTKRNKKYRRTKTLRRGGFKTSEYLKKYTSPNAKPSVPSTTNQEPKKYGSLLSGITTSVTRSAKAYNMPAILGAISSKMNALLIHNKVNYEFSNGYNARDYDIASVAANGNNDGRGKLKDNAKRGEITGIQSKVFNMGTDSYNKYKSPATPTPPK